MGRRYSANGARPTATVDAASAMLGGRGVNCVAGAQKDAFRAIRGLTH